MGALDAFAAITRAGEPLAAHTHLRIGGPADYFVQPRNREELANVVRTCAEQQIPLRVLGEGCNVLVGDAGYRGAVVRLSEPAFTQVRVSGQRIEAGAGATLEALIGEAARHGLAGMETLVGFHGTVGGTLRTNAGDRMGEVSQFVRRVEALDSRGTLHVRDRDDMQFGYHMSNLDDAVLLAAEFELEPDSPAAIVKRMRKTWILRKATQPFSYQSAAQIFRNPRGMSAAAMIEQAGLARSRFGQAEISDRDANCVVVSPGATAKDVLQLIAQIRERVEERFNVELELEITVW
jgi:UDP-N-acetylmuramate dehydrogenase